MMRSALWTTKELLKVSADYLKEKEIDNPRLTAEVLLAHQLNINRVELYLNLTQPLKETEVSGYRELIRRRVQREPLQYITNTQEFWSLDFTVDKRVLIPRPETELLIELAIKKAHEPSSNKHPLKILDLCTGSGAIAVTLAKEIPGAKLVATDISQDAIDLARFNAEKHDVSDRIQFIQGNLWEPLKKHGEKFDLILSNPPYVGIQEYNALQPEVRDHEPRIALDGGKDGTNYIHKIINGCEHFLNPGAWLLMEMTPLQTIKALKLMEQVAFFDDITRIKDYFHRYRVVCAKIRCTK